jgi:hypothetical protein
MCTSATRRSCHERHIEAAHVVMSFLEPNGKVAPTVDDYVMALGSALDGEWEDLRCGHFTMWLWRKLLAHMGDLERYEGRDDRALQSSVRSWYRLSRQMIDAEMSLNDPRQETIDPHAWTDEFKRHFAAAKPSVAKLLLQYFEDYLPSSNVANIDMLAECLSTIAAFVSEIHTDLQDRFLQAAASSVHRAPSLGPHLLERVTEIVAKNPVNRLRYLSRFVRSMDRNDNKDAFSALHAKVNGWVDAEKRPDFVAQLRRAEEELVPLLLGHPPRERRYSTMSVQVDALLKVQASDGRSIEISGRVRDASGGVGDRFARGIHVHAESWSFTSASDPSGMVDGKWIRARRLVDNLEACFSSAGLELFYPSRKRLTCSSGQCVRGFTYNPKYHLGGGGLVLFMTEAPEDELSLWRKFIKQRMRVSYQDQLG